LFIIADLKFPVPAQIDNLFAAACLGVQKERCNAKQCDNFFHNVLFFVVLIYGEAAQSV
jgi:hypothetical protein